MSTRNEPAALSSDLDSLGLVGTTLAETYAVESVVREGGFAIVYKAMHLVWKRPVALKVLTAAAACDEERAALLEAFIREGAILADLSERTAAICQARDVGLHTTAQGTTICFMVLEWLEGTSLEDVVAAELAQGAAPRTLVEVVQLIGPVAHALSLAHAMGIAHRDVKPPNIIVLGNPRGASATLKLLDFGVAKTVEDVAQNSRAFRATTALPTSFTALYGAPEQFERTYGATGPWTDVFALALVMGELLTFQEPLKGRTHGDLASASSDPTVRPTPRTLGANITDAVERVFEKALAVMPGDRYRNAAELWTALLSAMGLAAEGTAKTGRASSPALAPTLLVSKDLTRTTVDPTRVLTSVGSVPPVAPARSRWRSFGAVATIAAVLALSTVTVARVRGQGTQRADGVAATPLTQTAPHPSATGPMTCPPGMVTIPGASFGSDLASYCIDEIEVTTEKYRECSVEGACSGIANDNEWPGITDRERQAYDSQCNGRSGSARARHPMNCVDWHMATAYCASSGRRLPTGAEWELAASGQERTKPGDEDVPLGERLNACGKECAKWAKRNGLVPNALHTGNDGFPGTAPAGSFPRGASYFGVHDVLGNVSEWVSDRDPRTDNRVVRGSAWDSAAPSAEDATFRAVAVPTQRSARVGFRCAVSLQN